MTTIYKEKDIFIYDLEKQTENLKNEFYDMLKKVNLENIYNQQNGVNNNKYDIGFKIIIRMIEEMFKERYKPAIIYIETSLFPRKIGLSQPNIKDFVAVKFCNNKDKEKKRKELLTEIDRAYNNIYPEIHKNYKTIYYTPSFLIKAKEMRMLFTKYMKSENNSENKVNTNSPKEANNKWGTNDKQIYQISYELKTKNTKRRKEKEEDLKKNATNFHKSFHEEAFKDYEQSYMLHIPIIGATVKKKYFIGLGAIFILLGYEKKIKINDDTLEKKVNKLGKIVSYFLKDIFSSFLYNSNKDLLNEVKTQANKHAVSAIMSRNMSHNLGSHVLFYAKYVGETLNLYLRERMDFINAITTLSTFPTEPTWFYKRLINNFKNQKELLSNIAKSEGIQNIKINIIKDKKYKNDVQIAIPLGSSGRHAFYSILENIIRNKAKHGLRNAGNNNNKLVLKIKIEDHKDLFKITVFTPEKCNNNDFKKIKNFCTEDIIDERGSIRPDGWGIKEMRFCAAFLRKIPIEKTGIKSEIQKLKPALLTPIRNDHSDFFGYEFYMLKNIEAFVIGSTSIKNKKELKDKGIVVSRKLPDEFKGANPYIVISTKQVQKNINQPIRVITESSLNINKINEEYPLKAYSDWIKETFIKDNKKKVRLIINLSGTKGENITDENQKSWGKISKCFNEFSNGLFELCPIYNAKFKDEHFNGQTNDQKLIILLYDVHGVLFKDKEYEEEYGQKYFDYGPSPFQVDDLNIENFKKEYKKQYVLIDEVLKKHGVNINSSLTITPEQLKDAFNELINIPNFQELIKGNKGLSDASSEAVNEEIICKNKQKLVRIYPLTLENSHNYYEALNEHLLQPILQNPPENQFQAKKFILALIEAALTKIYVLDERINNNVVSREKNEYYPERETYERMNVMVPEFDYSRPTKGKLNELGLGQIKPHLVIIHQGILDKAFENDQEKMEKWVDETVSSTDGHVFVVSGRGMPPNKPRNARFIAASTITEYLITNRSKFHLVQSLFSL